MAGSDGREGHYKLTPARSRDCVLIEETTWVRPNVDRDAGSEPIRDSKVQSGFRATTPELRASVP